MPEGYTSGGGLSAGWQKRLTPEQQASLDIQKILFQHSRPFTRTLEDWEDEARRERGLSPEAWKKEVLSQPSDQKLNEAINVALSFGMGIVDPKYKLQAAYRDPELAEYTVHRAEGGDPIGRMRFDYTPEKKQLYLGWASKNEGIEDLGAGQMMHLFREVGKDFPEAETVRFYRIPNEQKAGGGTVGRKGYTEEVTLPLKRRAKGVESEATREMFGQAVEQEQKKSRVVRRRMEQGPTEYDEDIRPNYSLLRDLSEHDQEIADLMEEGAFDDISYHTGARFRERMQRLGAEGAVEVNDQLNNKALQRMIEERRARTGVTGQIPTFEEAYERGLHLEHRATRAAMEEEERRLTRLLQQIRGSDE